MKSLVSFPSQCPKNRASERAVSKVLPLALFIFTSSLYFATRSISLDEWDSVQFVLGTQEFNLDKHQPHPPGYPVYIFLGWSLIKGFSIEPQTAFLMLSSLGGGLFVASWFCLIARQLEARLALLCSLSLAFLPALWMSSTKVMTDSLGSGLLALQLLLALRYSETKTFRYLALAALIGALSAGARPQNSHIVLLILLAFLWRSKVRATSWFIGLFLLVCFCAIWLVPTMYTQAYLPESSEGWATYPSQLLKQWEWRLDKPGTYVGASDFSAEYFLKRIKKHWLGWFRYGFGLRQKGILGWLGDVLCIAGIALYFIRGVYRQPQHKTFWKQHLLWAVPYVLTIFISLPEFQRYYLPILPLVLIVPLCGCLSLKRPWNKVAVLFPILFMVISLPLAIENHAQEAPPVRMIRYLQAVHPPLERSQVLLVLDECFRHGQWYAGDFQVKRLGRRWEKDEIVAVYSDTPDVLEGLPKGSSLVEIAQFRRTPVIWPKHDKVKLYRVQF